MRDSLINSSSHQANSLTSNLILNLISVDSVQGVDMIFDYYQRKGEVINQDLYSAYIRLIKKEEVLLYFQDKYEKQLKTVKSETQIPKPTKKEIKPNISAPTRKTKKKKKNKNQSKYKLLLNPKTKSSNNQDNKEKSGRKGIALFMEKKNKGTASQNDEIYKRRNTKTPFIKEKSESVYAISTPMGGRNKQY